MDHPRIAALRKCIEELKANLDVASHVLDAAQESFHLDPGMNLDRMGTSSEGDTEGIHWSFRVGV